MAQTRRERAIENLALASALGFLALVLAAISLGSDSRAAAKEREALSPTGAALEVVGRAQDPSFDRVYLVRADSNASYATVLTLRSPSCAVLVGASFSPKGELRELRYLGGPASRLPANAKDALRYFPGASEALDRAAVYVRSLSGSAEEGKS